jgi:transketolase
MALSYDDLPALLQRLTGDEKHDWSSLSTLDVVWALHGRVLAEGDRFFLSKGHGPTATYAVLAAKGVVPLELLDGFGTFDSPLGHHPDRRLVPGLEISSGSLGHGLGMAVGSVLGGRRVWCLVGDAELEEGSNWEAIQLAGRLELGALTVVAIDNHSSTHGWPGGLEPRFELDGWDAKRVDGHDRDALAAALALPDHAERPRLVVAEVGRK